MYTLVFSNLAGLIVPVLRTSFLSSPHDFSSTSLIPCVPASFAVNFLKARQAKLAKKKYEETDAYKNNDVLPSSIAVDIYLESLKTLKSQKEHRKVDLFKELREKKSTKRRDISFQVRCSMPSYHAPTTLTILAQHLLFFSLLSFPDNGIVSLPNHSLISYLRKQSPD